MNLSIVKKDFKRNKAINVSLLLFIVLAAFLMSAATMISVQLFGSIDSMYNIAKPPHFMQMHVGEFDQQKVDEFANSIDYVTDWQTIEMVNVYGGNIWITKSDGSFFSMSDSLLDIGMVKQNLQYDLLLGMDNNVLKPYQGEIGIPIILLDRYDIEIGDTLTIKEDDYVKEFVVTYYVRDSQMNSTLTSSTRFLLHSQDHENLKANTGKIEYLIEFYLTDTSRAAEFQSAYENAEMPTNGQGITYAIIRLVSGLSGMIMVVVMSLVSLFVILVVFLCLRFTILTAMEEEIKSIGTMKAIGMSHNDIRQIFLLKYKVLAIIGCSIGYIGALLFSNIFTSQISQTFGLQRLSYVAVFIPIITVFLIYVLEVHFCKRVISKMKKITVVEALFGISDREHAKSSKLNKFIASSRFKNNHVNFFIAIKQVVEKSHQWIIVFLILLISTSIILIPLNLLNTFKSPDFITYMGQPMNDIIVQVPVFEKHLEKYNEVSTFINKDEAVFNFTVEARLMYEAVNKDNDWINIHVDCSEEAKNELQYLNGNAPISTEEIALSKMNADEMGVSVGDLLTMRINQEVVKISVSGVYQDVTSGGYTAKMIRSYDHQHVKRYSFFINVNQHVDIKEMVVTYQDALGMDVKVTDMEEFIDQTLGGVTSQLSKAVNAVAMTALMLVALITVLFLRLQMRKEYSQIAIMKAIGFSILDIRKQYLIKMSLMSLLGIVIGTILANTQGELVVSSIINMIGLGISSISFSSNLFEVYFLIPMVILMLVVLVTWLSSSTIKQHNIMELINE